MELVAFLPKLNDYLEQFYIFHALRFMEGVILVVLLLNVLLLIWMLVFRGKYFLEFSMGHGIPEVKDSMAKKWNKIKMLLYSNNQDDWCQAIIQAEKAVYEIFRMIKYQGKTLKEQLNGMFNDQIGNLEEMKWATEIVDLIKKSDKCDLSRDEAVKVLRIFGEALWEQEAIKEIGLDRVS